MQMAEGGDKGITSYLLPEYFYNYYDQSKITLYGFKSVTEDCPRDFYGGGSSR